MEIREGAFYVNKTSKYLFPILRNYGDKFVESTNAIYKYAIGIHDSNLKDTIGNYNILLLINTNYFPKHVSDYLDWIKEQSYFVHYYNPSPNPVENKKMIVLKIPEKFYSAYDNFIIGHYSGMYNENDINKLFNPYSEEYKVLTGSLEEKENFINKLKKEFNIKKLEIEDIQNYELDLPLIADEEIFNFFGGNRFVTKNNLFWC